MNIQKTIFTTLAVAIAIPTLALAEAVVIQTSESSVGSILIDGEDMSLYVFDKDTPAVSNCNDDCAVKWPPLFASDNSRPNGEFGIIVRAEGSLQWSYKGQPLYTWFKDTEAGDITGDGVKGVWHLARP